LSLRRGARWLFSLSAVLFSTPSVSVRRSHPQPREPSSACSGEVDSSVFCRRIGFWHLWRSSASIDCAVLRGRTQSISWELWIGFLLEVSSFEIEQGASRCLLEDFGRVGGHILEDCIQHQRGPWEDSVDPQGRYFRGLTISETLSGLFWVL